VELVGKQYGNGDWRRLLATRRGTVTVAVLCGLVAVAILIFAMSRYRHAVSTEGHPETVLVAGQEIQKGTSGDAIASEQLFKPTTVAPKQASAGAIADVGLLRGKVAATDIYPGQQITAADFTAAGGIAGELARNERAMTVSLSGSRGMAGQIQPGDHVDVYADIDEAGSSRGQTFVRLLMGNVSVLKAPTEATASGLGGGGAQNAQSNVTLKVSDNQAGALAFATDNGKLWLVLRPANASTPPASTVTVQSLLAGTAPVYAGGQR
jgi:Flp pilus assembly protein CpaB